MLLNFKNNVTECNLIFKYVHEVEYKNNKISVQV